MPGPRIPSWLLVVVTGLLCVGMITLESADLFPVWRFAVQWSPEALPSSQAVPAKEIASGRPVLSLTLDPADLNDPDKGILPNKLKHGVDWEREGLLGPSSTWTYLVSDQVFGPNLLRGLANRTGVPCRESDPASGRWIPARIFPSVLFPAPFSPHRAWHDPDATSSETSLRASAPGKRLTMPWNRMAGSVTAGDQRRTRSAERGAGLDMSLRVPRSALRVVQGIAIAPDTRRGRP